MPTISHYPMLKRFAVSALIAACPILVHASGSEDDVFTQELPLVLTASRLLQPVSEAPSAVTIIDRDMIAASGFRTVPDLMRLVPGMYVGFADANRPVTSLHGSSDEFARRMQVLIDGRSAYLPPMGGVNWADLPLLIEDIERIEVVRGPSSASHGANSFYGVINIISREATDQNGTAVSLSGGYASDGSVRFGGRSGNLDYRMSLGYRSDPGLDDGILNDHNRTGVVNFRGSYHPRPSDNVDLQLGFSDGMYGLGIEGRPENAFRNTTARSSFQQINWLHIWPDGDESKLTYSHATRASRDPYICIDSEVCQFKVIGKTREQGFVARDMFSERNELEWQSTSQFGARNRLVWGLGIRSDYADFPLLFTHPYTVNPWRLFVHDEWRWRDSSVFNMGTMLEDDGMGNRSHSPRASVNYHLSPNHTLRIGVSTATRSPIMSEAFIAADNTIWGGAYVPPVRPIKPERVLSREIGFVGDFPELGLSVESRVYNESVRNLIWWDKCVNLSNCADSFANLLAAEYQGLELTAKLRWDKGRSFLVANYARQRGSATLDALPTQYLNPIIGHLVQAYYEIGYLGPFPELTPTNSGSLLLSLALPDAWRFSTGYYFRDQVRVMDVAPDVTPEYAMHRFDVRLAKTLSLEQGRKLDLNFVVQNLNRDPYTKYGTVNRAAEVPFTRRAWLNASLQF